MNILTLVAFAAGIGTITAGAEAFIHGARRLATLIGLSPLVIGATVVAFGTGAPELVVVTQSSLTDHANLAVGNVVGSNIFNILFTLGVAALIAPLYVAQRLVRLEVPLLIGVSVLVWLLGLNGSINRLDGVLLFAGMLVYTYFVTRQCRQESRQVQQEYAREFGGIPLQGRAQIIAEVALIVIGLLLLVVGSRWLVNSAVTLAEALGLGELIIGLTIVSIGTSLPETAVSIVAIVRGERDIAVGNVIGSNLFNILAVLGLASAVSPTGVNVPPGALGFDIPVMTVVALACLPIFANGNVIARWEGGLFLGYYAAYTLYVILDATQHDALPLFSLIMAVFVLPLTVITFFVVTLRVVRGHQQHEGPAAQSQNTSLSG
jgi:cation:H+ antiporter